MKSKLLITILCCLFLSCKTYKREKFQYYFGKNDIEWINMYKTEVFFSCLRKGYKNETIFKAITKEDLLVPYEPILSEYGKIDTLTAKVIEKIPKPVYPHCDDCTEEEQKEILQKNYVCATCLNYYASRELDSIAKKRYELFKLSNK